MTAAGTVHRPVRQVVLQAPRPVKTLIVGIFVIRMGSFFATFATLFLTKRGFSPNTLPVVLVAIGLAGMLGSLGGGWLADRIGSRASLVGSLVTSSAAVAMLIVMPNHPTVVIAVCLVALCSQSYQPAASALLIGNTAPDDRVPTFAFYRLALNVGVAIGAVIAGFLASRSYSALFAVEAVAYAGCALVVFLGLRHAHEPRTEPEAEPGTELDAEREPLQVGTPDEPALVPVPGAVDVAAHAPQPRRNLPVWLLCTLFFGVGAIYTQYQSTLPLQLVRHGYPTTFYGALLTVNAAVVIVGELPISSITRRLPWVLPLVAGVMVMAIGLACAALISLSTAIVLAFVVFTFGEMTFAPVSNAAVADISPPGTEGRYQGLLSTAQGLGWSLGPAIGTTVFALSRAGLWIGMVLAAGALGAGMYGVWRITRRPATAEPPRPRAMTPGAAMPDGSAG